MTNRLMTIPFAPISLGTLDTVTGGYHDPAPSEPSGQAGIGVAPHRPSVTDRLGQLAGKLGPLIRCLS